MANETELWKLFWHRVPPWSVQEIRLNCFGRFLRPTALTGSLSSMHSDRKVCLPTEMCPPTLHLNNLKVQSDIQQDIDYYDKIYHNCIFWSKWGVRVRLTYELLGLWSCVSSMVVNELWLLGKCPPTLTALIRFLSCVNPLMVHKLWLLREGFPTLTAAIRPLTCVCPLMRNEVWLPREGFATLPTFEGFLSCVYSSMVDETWLLSEGFSALTAFIRFFSCMSSLMSN